MSRDHIVIPLQVVEMQPTDQDGRWLGSVRFCMGEGNRAELRVEAYAADSASDTVQGLITDLHQLADFGSQLQTVTIAGRAAFLAFMPKGA